MRFRRRTFLKAGGALSGAAALNRFVRQAPATLASAGPSPAALAEEWVPTTCWIGKQDCGILARRIGGRVVKLEGHPDHPLNRGTLCPKGVAQITALYDPHRLRTPLVRTNEKGVSGRWRRASWDEALGLVAQEIRQARARDPQLVAWQKGRSKAKPFYDDAFVKASGALKLHHGAYCSDAGYRACEYTIGLHGVLHPDFRHTRYLLAWGYNLTNAGGNKLCWITWPRYFNEARQRGMKVVAIDPRLRGAGPFADEWLPIRPGTDLALALGLAHLLVEAGTVDREYLRRHTNAPFLLGPDDLFVRREGKELVWDERSGRAAAFDEAGLEAALEGRYQVDGVPVRTAYQALREHLAVYDPQTVGEICGLPPERIRAMAGELAELALIGSTMDVDGITLPYRPVAIMAYHMVQQELGFQAVRGMLLVMMLLGAIEAVGGQRTDFTWKPHENYQKLDQVEIKDPPYNAYLKDSRFFPINSNNSSVVARVMLDPQRYGVQTVPEVLVVHMANPLVSFASQPDLMEAYRRFKFVAVIDPWLSETADYFADVVLPAAAMEKYEGPINASDPYVSATALRLPIMEPFFESRDEVEIYLDLCEAAGILYGEEGYLARLNTALKLEGEHALPTGRKPPVREIFDRWARANGIEEGVAYFQANGVKVKGPLPASKIYGYAQDPPFDGLRHRLYGESLLRYRETMRSKGAEEVYWRDYTPLPTWRRPTMDGSPAAYDLYLISYKMVEFKQSRSTFLPLLAELAPTQRLDINPRTARAKGIDDGQEVWVESHNALTGETRRVRVAARHTEAIRPDVVGMPHHYGMWAHPGARDHGPTPNTLFFTGEGYVANTADQSFHVKVRVTPA